MFFSIFLDKIIFFTGEVKPDLNTILCYKPSNSVLMKRKKKKKIIASDQLPEISSFTSTSSSTANTDERTVRQKSWDYKPSNRYENKMSKGRRSVVTDKPSDKFAVTFLKRRDAGRFFNKKGLRSRNSWANTDNDLDMTRGELLSRAQEIDEHMLLSNAERSSTKKPKRFNLPNVHFQDLGYTKTSIEKPFKKSKTKERMFQIITHDRVMMKFYPMQLDNTYWILEFLETYLDMKRK